MKMTKTVKEIVAEIKTKMDQAGGLKHVYFVACGGSKAAIYRAFTFFRARRRHLAPLPIRAMNLFTPHRKNWIHAV